MSIAELEKNDPGRGYYNLNNKLWEHVLSRSQECFKRAKEARMSIKNKEELSEYTDKMRQGFIESLGGIPYDKSLPLNAKTVGIIKEEGLTIEKIIFESRPKVYVTANLYIPEKRKNPCGAVLFQLGHSAKGKSGKQYQKVARAICSAGLIVFVIDPVGQGERLSYYEPEIGQPMVPATTSEHQYAGEQCVLIGDNIARYFIADAMRAVDYLQSRPEVDSERIGATGSSGGGTATCYMMLCDERIKAAAPGTFVTNRRAYLYAGGAQDSEQIWMGATENGFDHHELLMCFAPKPVLVLVVDTDFFPIEGTEETVNEVKPFWAMYDAEDKLNMIVDESQHKYTDTLAIAAATFFANQLNGEERVADLSALKSISESALWCTKSGQVKTEFSDCRFVYDENLERYKNTNKPSKDLKAFLTEKINYSRKEQALHLRTFTPIYENGLKIVPYLWFAQEQIPNYGLMFSDFSKKPNGVVICLWDRGTDNLEEHIYKIREICREGKSALVLDLSGIGKCTPNSLYSVYATKARYGTLDRLTKDLFFLGDSLCALRLFELIYAINMVKEKFSDNVCLYAEGVSAAYARLCNIVRPDIKMCIQKGVPDYKEIVESKYYENYNISGILLPEIAKYL